MITTNEPFTKSFLFDRFSNLLDKENVFDFEIQDYNSKELVRRTILSSDEDDNISIQYHDLHGSPMTYRIKGQKQAKKYIRKRLKTPIDGMKYLSPKSAGLMPFLPPNLIKKYKAGEQIKSLFMIEGEFKALIASVNGVDCIGLGSIHGFYAPADNDRLYYKEFAPDIVDIIEKCRVENLIYLTDADTLSIRYNLDKDLYLRPNSFYKAVLNFRNICKRFVFSEESTVTNCFFAHIKREFEPSCKGIDDLIMNNADQTSLIIEDLLKLDNCTQFFNCINLKDQQESHLKRYFGLLNESNFYETYKDFLTDKEFVFKKVKYFFDSERLVTLQNLAFDDYLRVGVNYYKIINKTKLIEDVRVKSSEISPWNKGELITDFGKNCLGYIRKFDDFINEPNWINHREVIDNCYNVSKGLVFKPKQGSFSETINFLQHITNDTDFLVSENNHYKENPTNGGIGTMFLDYLSIMIQKPTHLLPILCLLSAEQETGKTTCAQLLLNMFEGNSIILQSKDFNGDFNGFWAGKFFVCIDEGNFDDKRAAKERIKQLSTSDTVTMNTKGVAQKQVQNFSKFMICSNDEDNFINLERMDKRFWIIPVKTIVNKDPDLKKKIFAEIPAFFNFLMEREIFHTRETRTWFADKYIQNDSFYAVLESSKAQWKQEIDAVILHVFDNIADDQFRATVKDLRSMVIAWNRSFRQSPTQIRDYLKKDLMLKPSPTPLKYETVTLLEVSNEVTRISGGTGRPYILNRADWCKEQKG